MAESKILQLEHELEMMRDAEHRLSQAYIRIRSMVGAFDTPTAPTSEQVWEHTEDRVKELFTILTEMESKIKNYAYDDPKAQFLLLPICEKLTRYRQTVEKYAPVGR